MSRSKCLRMGVFVLMIVVGGSIYSSEMQVQERPQAPPGAEVYLGPSAQALLEKNGFVVSPRRLSNNPEFAYMHFKDKRFPIFVTTDTLFHTTHRILDWYLRYLEISQLQSDLINLVDVMLSTAMEQYHEADSELVKRAALDNACFFTVAKQLLKPGLGADIPNDLRSRIQEEINLIEAHKGFSPSPIFDYIEDYSQYLPRGHYARSEELQRYFKAFVYLGRMGFRFADERVDSRKQTLQAILIAKALREGEIRGEKTKAVWKRIYETTSFFAGQAEDPTPLVYAEFATEVYGPAISLEGLADETRLSLFIQKAKRLPLPRILSTYEVVPPGTEPRWALDTAGMHFLPQRFTVDAHIFQNLVYDSVGRYLERRSSCFTLVNAQGFLIRGFPRALDLMAVFGSAQALKILEEEGDTEYKGYEKRFREMQKQYGRPSLEAPQDLYEAKMNCLRLLLADPAPGAPDFMENVAWKRKDLATMLASWTELKHDTIVYTKQPYASRQMALSALQKGGPTPPPPPPVHGYVEPRPEVYAALKELISNLRGRHESLKFAKDRGLARNLQSFETLLGRLESIARKELKGELPDDKDQDLIENIGFRLRRILRFTHYIDISEKFISRMDEEMPIVADVFTDSNSKFVLEEGVGWPFTLWAECQVDGKPTLCAGVVYSYYEFRWPLADRLTDEKWRQMLATKKAPSLPTWTKVYIATEAE